jgi:EmrB/QacA subfamily drug resistance transporter
MNRPRERWAALGVLCLSLLAIVVDNTIVNVALPSLVRDLEADVAELQWVVDAYTLVFAGLLLLAGALGDRYGRRRTLLGGLVVFGAASGWAAYAGGVDGLIMARAVMGAGAACIMPATLSLLIGVFTDTRERTMAIGIWAATAGLGVALGPVLGGFLLEHFWWGSIFIVNVPLTAIAVVAGRRLLPESRDPVVRRIDWTGAGLSGAGLVALVWAVIEAPTKGWTSGPVLAAGALAAVALAGFVVWQRRVAEPLLDVRLFADPRFTAASSTITVLFFALFGFLFLSTQYLQFVLGVSPSAAGVRVLPYAGAMIVFAPLSSQLVVRFGTRRLVVTGMLLFSIGLAVAATVGTNTGYGRLAIALLLMGAGMGLAGAPATASIMSALPPDRANIGSAVNDTTRELGGALGVAVIGSIMSSLYASQLSHALPDGVPAPVAAAARASIGAGVQISGSFGAEIADAARDAFVQAMSRASIVAALVAGLGALIAWRTLAWDDEPSSDRSGHEHRDTSARHEGLAEAAERSARPGPDGRHAQRPPADGQQGLRAPAALPHHDGREERAAPHLRGDAVPGRR